MSEEGVAQLRTRCDGTWDLSGQVGEAEICTPSGLDLLFPQVTVLEWYLVGSDGEMSGFSGG